MPNDWEKFSSFVPKLKMFRFGKRDVLYFNNKKAVKFREGFCCVQ